MPFVKSVCGHQYLQSGLSHVVTNASFQIKVNECTGMTQMDGMGREEGGGFRKGNTCIPVADSF